jgi:APA family basic amino acid/polyamine antiporter
VATIITGVGVGVTSLFTSLDAMVNLTNIGTLFAFFLVCIGVIVLRYKEPNRERPFKVPGGALFLPLLGAISALGLAWYLPPDSWMRFFLWLAAGMVFYVVYGYRHSRLRHKL